MHTDAQARTQTQTFRGTTLASNARDPFERCGRPCNRARHNQAHCTCGWRRRRTARDAVETNRPGRAVCGASPAPSRVFLPTRSIHRKAGILKSPPSMRDEDQRRCSKLAPERSTAPRPCRVGSMPSPFTTLVSPPVSIHNPRFPTRLHSQPPHGGSSPGDRDARPVECSRSSLLTLRNPGGKRDEGTVDPSPGLLDAPRPNRALPPPPFPQFFTDSSVCRGRSPADVPSAFGRDPFPSQLDVARTSGFRHAEDGADRPGGRMGDRASWRGQTGDAAGRRSGSRRVQSRRIHEHLHVRARKRARNEAEEDAPTVSNGRKTKELTRGRRHAARCTTCARRNHPTTTQLRCTRSIVACSRPT
eukprot:scaffold319_cov362-Pavlova_lutheri.AAC.31